MPELEASSGEEDSDSDSDDDDDISRDTDRTVRFKRQPMELSETDIPHGLDRDGHKYLLEFLMNRDTETCKKVTFSEPYRKPARRFKKVTDRGCYASDTEDEDELPMLMRDLSRKYPVSRAPRKRILKESKRGKVDPSRDVFQQKVNI